MYLLLGFELQRDTAGSMALHKFIYNDSESWYLVSERAEPCSD